MQPVFMKPKIAEELRERYGTPLYVYSQEEIVKNVQEVMNFPNPYGLTPRYAMKACSTAAILLLLQERGMWFDASSGFEAERAIMVGIEGCRISVASQQFPNNIKYLVEQGVHFTACSLNQLKQFGNLFPGSNVALRINFGIGSGLHAKTNVGGPAASFGVWIDAIDTAIEIAEIYQLRITKLHSHIGSGAESELWLAASKAALSLLDKFPDVDTLNLGGGFKVKRHSNDIADDLQKIGGDISQLLLEFHEKSGRKIKLEIEPGAYIIATAGNLLSTIDDITSTSDYTFLKLDTGMTEILRPCLYGSQHEILNLTSRSPTSDLYIIVGHCCESSDLLTPAPGFPDHLQPRSLPLSSIGDLILIEGTGAYCSSMSARNYNSYPISAEVLLKPEATLIRRRQSMVQIIDNELF
jgi:diaminopimelate decarboxylase